MKFRTRRNVHRFIKEILAFLKEVIPEHLHSRTAITGGVPRDCIQWLLFPHKCPSVLDHTILDIDLIMDATDQEITDLGAWLIEASASAKESESNTAAPVYLLTHSIYKRIQIARPRGEKKIGHGHNGFEYVVLTEGTVHEKFLADAFRRDFGINSLMFTLAGEFRDVAGGVSQIKAGQLELLSDAFFADPVRFFRACRFEAYGFSMSDATIKRLQAHDWSADFAKLPRERVWQELEKAMRAKYPDRFFRALVKIGVGLDRFFPEVLQFLDIPAGPIDYHPEGNLFEHSIQVLEKVERVTKDPIARLAAFYHDLGKLATDPKLYPSHHNHDANGVHEAQEVMHRIRAPHRVASVVKAINALHMKASNWDELRQGSRLSLAESAMKAGVSNILPIIVMADSGVEMPNWAVYVDGAKQSARMLGCVDKVCAIKDKKDIRSLLVQYRIDYIRKRLKLIGRTVLPDKNINIDFEEIQNGHNHTAQKE